jgi:hypothetical protein
MKVQGKQSSSRGVSDKEKGLGVGLKSLMSVFNTAIVVSVNLEVFDPLE